MDKKIIPLLIVSSLGYFVDAFDLVVFSVGRTSSLTDLGYSGDAIKNVGISLENWQAWGLLIGGIFWGIFGDKKGRMKVLYGSIALYSIANIVNGLITPNWGDVKFYYSICRFFAGLGLAGELGAGITLVSEAVKTQHRGIGTMIVAAFGLLGAVCASYLGGVIKMPWNTLFLIGGISGIVLLFLRIGVYESNLFMSIENQPSIKKGDFLSLFMDRNKFMKLLNCILIGLPTYFIIGLPVKFSKEFGAAFNIKETIPVPIAIMTCYIAMSLSDVICNLVSQKLQKRKPLFYFFNVMSLCSILLFGFFPPTTVNEYVYFYCPLLGLSVGYWALLVTNAAEKFGTNLRSTVAVSVPNFIRATFIPISILFKNLESSFGTINTGVFIGCICSIIAILATYSSEETFNKDLNYTE
jgi:MFS transporter, putative metabolite:H+ symporter